MKNKHNIIPRHASEDIDNALSFMNIVAITGAHGCGKTTLAKNMARKRGMKFVSLGDPSTYQRACNNPRHFISSLRSRGAVIDEIQRIPKLANALTLCTEENQRFAKFVITGSTHKFPLLLADLGTDVYRVELETFSQGEIKNLPLRADFLSALLKGETIDFDEHSYDSDIWPRVLRGGYPNAVLADNSTQSRLWLKNYKDLSIIKYIKDFYKIRKIKSFDNFILKLAKISGNPIKISKLAQDLGVSIQTINRWLWILDSMHITDRLYSWTHPMLQNVISQPPRIHFFDSGLLASLCGWENLDPILDREKRQPLLKSFVYGELRKSLNHLEGFPLLGSYKHQDGTEVDFIAHSSNLIVGIDVKASPSLKPSDFEGLKHLRKQIRSSDLPYGEKLVCGVIFHTGKETQCFDGELYGVPVGKLWAHARSQQQELALREQQAGA